jgi:hypothetical protein
MKIIIEDDIGINLIPDTLKERAILKQLFERGICAERILEGNGLLVIGFQDRFVKLKEQLKSEEESSVHIVAPDGPRWLYESIKGRPPIEMGPCFNLMGLVYYPAKEDVVLSTDTGFPEESITNKAGNCSRCGKPIKGIPVRTSTFRRSTPGVRVADDYFYHPTCLGWVKVPEKGP